MRIQAAVAGPLRHDTVTPLDRPRQTRDELRDHLSALGVPLDVVTSYLELACHGHLPTPDEALHLRKFHLMSPGGAAVPIRVATSALTASERARLAGLEADAAQLQHIDLNHSHGSFLEILSGAESINEAYAQLQRAASAEVCTFDRPPYLHRGMVMSPDQTDMLASGVAYRTIYQSAHMQCESFRTALKKCMDDGEEARIHQDLPMRLMIVDRQRCLIILPPPGERTDPAEFSALLVYPSVLLESLAHIFESTWNRSLPVDLKEGVESSPQSVDRRILTLMTAGLTDAAIARALAVSERTVARRISAMQKRLDAPSRFVLGVHAAHNKMV